MNRLFLAALILAVVAMANGLTFGKKGVRRRTPGRVKKPAYICEMEVGEGKLLPLGRFPMTVHTVARKRDCVAQCGRYKNRRHKDITGVNFFVRDDSKWICHCLKGKFVIDRSKTDFNTCAFRKSTDPKPTLTDYVPPVPVHCRGLGSTFKRVGCMAFPKRGRYLVNQRYQIKWAADKHAGFACGFVQACAAAAKAAYVKHFATHYWGECWAVTLTEGTEVASGEGCSVADGTYKTLCAGKDFKEECLGTTNYYVYSNEQPMIIVD